MTIITPERIEEIRKRLEGITPFPWMAGHLADDTSSCNCTSVLSESYAGAVCTVEPNNGKRISDGGNDGAPLEEAKANLRFLAHAPQDISDLLSAYDALSRDEMRGLMMAAKRYVVGYAENLNNHPQARDIAVQLAEKIDAALSPDAPRQNEG